MHSTLAATFRSTRVAALTTPEHLMSRGLALIVLLSLLSLLLLNLQLLARLPKRLLRMSLPLLPLATLVTMLGIWKPTTRWAFYLKRLA